MDTWATLTDVFGESLSKERIERWDRIVRACGVIVEPKLPDSYYEMALSKREQSILLSINSRNTVYDHHVCQMLINYGLVRKVISTKRLVVDEPTMAKEKYELTPLGIRLVSNYSKYNKFILLFEDL